MNNSMEKGKSAAHSAGVRINPRRRMPTTGLFPWWWLCAVVSWTLTAPPALSQPGLRSQPGDQSVSLGANVSYQVVATVGSAYQWNFYDAAWLSATNRTLVLTNVALSAAGGYSVIVFDAAGAGVTSRVAMISVDPTFTKITTGAIVT